VVRRPAVRHGRVRFHVRDLAHAGDDGGDGVVGEAEAQRELGQGLRLALREQLLQPQDAVPDLALAVPPK
jgi:hypothetical protein